MTAVNCPHCHTSVKWVEEYVGKEAGCPKCQRRFVMPSAPSSGMDHAPGYNPMEEERPRRAPALEALLNNLLQAQIVGNGLAKGIEERLRLANDRTYITHILLAIILILLLFTLLSTIAF